jgi:uncharacterized membrane protein YfcA
MPLLPHAHAASLLRRDDAGRTVFFAGGADKRGYVVPDVGTEQRILSKLKHIRLAELAAWVSIVTLLVGALVVTDGAVSIPKWLFILGLIIAALAIELPSEWARRRLARDLVPRDEHAPEPSLLERLPGWAVVIVVAVAVGLAIYFGKMGPLKAIAWLDDLPLALHESKALAKVAVFIVGAAAVLWGAFGALGKRFRHSRGNQEKT